MKRPVPRDRVILHVDMDAFFASVEQRDHPEWRGRPLVVGAGPRERGVVAAASYEARKFGIRSAMPSREAGRRCPDAIFTPPDMDRYAAVSKLVFRIFERFTPCIEPLSIDEAFLDVTGSLRLFGDGPVIAGRIRGAIRDELRLTASVGVARNKFLAKVASDINKPDGLTIVPNDDAGVARFLAPLPISCLWGVGKVTRTALEEGGLRTVGDVRRASQAHLAGLVGDDRARHFKALAEGVDDRDIVTDWEEKSISREHTFPEDCLDPDVVKGALLDLVDDVGRRLRAAGKYAEVVQLKLRWQGFETITRQRTPDDPICDDFALRSVATSLLSSVPLEKPVRLVGFGASRITGARSGQLPLFRRDGLNPGKTERLSRAVDNIREKVGEDRIGRPKT
jgi:DNA polymerase-4